jgi:tRNA(Ile)-lysidine synthase TilS/MesJ
MRKGALYNKAVELGANKIALGHHRDDLLDTLMMSMFYEGRMSTFAPKSYLDRTGLTLIRPMLYIKEVDLISYAKELPVLKSECPANKQTKREEVKTIINDINKKIPGVRDMLFTALTHPDRYNLFDRYISEIDKIL